LLLKARQGQRCEQQQMMTSRSPSSQLMIQWMIRHWIDQGLMLMQALLMLRKMQLAQRAMPSLTQSSPGVPAALMHPAGH
jgi:hypothetical protein